MSTTEALDLASENVDTGRLMYRVAAELQDIAAAVDRVREASHSSMELLEASRAIQSALVSLSNWSGPYDAGIPVANPGAGPLTLQEAWIAARLAHPLDARRSTWPDA